jgi:hypothetical protein
LAIGVATAAAVAAHLINSPGPLVDAFGDVREACRLGYYSTGEPLRHALVPSHLLALLAVTLVALRLACERSGGLLV